jgi:hypothetical protein
MGANTYIGNAPNFMVKAIAEAAGCACRASSATDLQRRGADPALRAVTLLFF